MVSISARSIVSPIAEHNPVPRTKEATPPSARSIEDARQRALVYLLGQSLEERRAADGRQVGIQSTLSATSTGDCSLELYGVLDGLVTDPARAEDTFADDPLRDFWQDIANEIQERLGFPLEPELFSNMLVVALTGHLDVPELASVKRTLLATFRKSDAHGLYHFFTSLRFACDTDCTGMALRARLATGDLDPTSKNGRNELRRSTDRLLRSAAVIDVPADRNATYGKSNGALRRHVFKVYLDDHEVQGALLDRGLKNNPVVSVNALLPVLVELSFGLRDPKGIVSLKEYLGPEQPSRRGEASVAQIVAANLSYVAGHLLSGDWRSGCRYYGAPEAFLAFYAELITLFPEVDELFGVREVLLSALLEERQAQPDHIADPSAPLNIALRAIALQDLGIQPDRELRALVEAQDADGGFHRYSPLYGLGTKKHSMYFGSTELTTFLAHRALSEHPGVRLGRGPTLPVAALTDAIWCAATEERSLSR